MEQIRTEKVFLRDVVGGYLKELGEIDSRVVLVNADLMGTCRNRSFAEHFPERTFNVGIAEQNLVSFAAGLAHEGFIPYVFSMAPFLSMRACEQCRTDVAYSNLNVRLIAAYAGCSGGISGPTHWGMEDCAIMSSMPNMTVLEPSDENQAKKMLVATLHHSGPIYLRTSVEPVCRLYPPEEPYRIGKATTVCDGNDGAFLCSGVTVGYAKQAAEAIAVSTNKRVRVVDMHTIKPVDRDAVLSAAQTGRIIVAQDHTVIGGLGDRVARILAEEAISVSFRVIGIEDRFATMAHADYLYHVFGFDSEGLEKSMLALLTL